MRHGLQSAGISLLWLVGLNMGLECLMSNCIVGSRDRLEFPLFFRHHWQSICTALTGRQCLRLGLCKETVKESRPAKTHCWPISMNTYAIHCSTLCPARHLCTPKGHFLDQIPLANAVFLATVLRQEYIFLRKPLKIMFLDQIIGYFRSISLTIGILELEFLKITQEWYMRSLCRILQYCAFHYTYEKKKGVTFRNCIFVLAIWL